MWLVLKQSAAFREIAHDAGHARPSVNTDPAVNAAPAPPEFTPFNLACASYHGRISLPFPMLLRF